MKHAETCNVVQQIEAFQQISDGMRKPETSLHDEKMVSLLREAQPRKLLSLRYMDFIVEGDYVKLSSATMCFTQAAPLGVQRNMFLHHFPTSLHTNGIG